MIVKLLNEHHLEFLSLKGGCRGSSESYQIVGNQFFKVSQAGSTVSNQHEVTTMLIQ